tara:strand:+ start:867 stop:1106 length:240 start_codon:yes stop_codon:yes gene_type:complete
MPKVSNLFEQKKIVNSKAYNSLTPKMKEAVEEMFKMINNKGNIIFNVENAVGRVAEIKNINKEELYQYIEKETNEQLGV